MIISQPNKKITCGKNTLILSTIIQTDKAMNLIQENDHFTNTQIK